MLKRTVCACVLACIFASTSAMATFKEMNPEQKCGVASIMAITCYEDGWTSYQTNRDINNVNADLSKIPAGEIIDNLCRDMFINGSNDWMSDMKELTYRQNRDLYRYNINRKCINEKWYE